MSVAVMNFRLRFTVQLSLGMEFSVSFPASYSTWTHVAMIYRGPGDLPGGIPGSNTGDDQGIAVYSNGMEAGKDDDLTTLGDYGLVNSGKLMIGRLMKKPSHQAHQARHTEAAVDELLIWNRKLSQEEIIMIKNMDYN